MKHRCFRRGSIRLLWRTCSFSFFTLSFRSTLFPILRIRVFFMRLPLSLPHLIPPSYPCLYSHLHFSLRSGIIQLDSLCIEPGKAVWVLYVDAMCINYDGNAFDATLAAMVSALKNSQLFRFISLSYALTLNISFYPPHPTNTMPRQKAKLPKATWIEDEERVVCSRKGGKEPLSVLRTPIANTFGIFDS